MRKIQKRMGLLKYLIMKHLKMWYYCNTCIKYSVFFPLLILNLHFKKLAKSLKCCIIVKMCSFVNSDTNYFILSLSVCHTWIVTPTTLSCHSQCVTPDLTLLTRGKTAVNRLLFITLANKVLQTVILLTLPYKGKHI